MVSAIWIFIVAPRLPSQCLGVEVGRVDDAMQEGNALDLNI